MPLEPEDIETLNLPPDGYPVGMIVVSTDTEFAENKGILCQVQAPARRSNYSEIKNGKPTGDIVFIYAQEVEILGGVANRLLREMCEIAGADINLVDLFFAPELTRIRPAKPHEILQGYGDL